MAAGFCALGGLVIWDSVRLGAGERHFDLDVARDQCRIVEYRAHGSGAEHVLENR